MNEVHEGRTAESTQPDVSTHKMETPQMPFGSKTTLPSSVLDLNTVQSRSKLLGWEKVAVGVLPLFFTTKINQKQKAGVLKNDTSSIILIVNSSVLLERHIRRHLG